MRKIIALKIIREKHFMAMYRMGIKTFGKSKILDIFYFD